MRSRLCALLTWITLVAAAVFGQHRGFDRHRCASRSGGARRRPRRPATAQLQRRRAQRQQRRQRRVARMPRRRRCPEGRSSSIRGRPARCATISASNSRLHLRLPSGPAHPCGHQRPRRCMEPPDAPNSPARWWAQIGHNPDPRLGWIVSDLLLRFLPPGSDLASGAISAFERLTRRAAGRRSRSAAQPLAIDDRPPDRLGHSRFRGIRGLQGTAVHPGRQPLATVLRRPASRHRLALGELGRRPH